MSDDGLSWLLLAGFAGGGIVLLVAGLVILRSPAEPIPAVGLLTEEGGRPPRRQRDRARA